MPGNMGTTADTAPTWISAFKRHSGAITKGFLALNVALLVLCLADWLGWLASERGFQPLRMVYLSGALVLQPLASLMQRRSMFASFVLLAASIALIVMSATVRR